MAYFYKTFKQGDILTAADLNNLNQIIKSIQDSTVDVVSKLNNPKVKITVHEYNGNTSVVPESTGVWNLDSANSALLNLNLSIFKPQRGIDYYTQSDKLEIWSWVDTLTTDYFNSQKDGMIEQVYDKVRTETKTTFVDEINSEATQVHEAIINKTEQVADSKFNDYKDIIDEKARQAAIQQSRQYYNDLFYTKDDTSITLHDVIASGYIGGNSSTLVFYIPLPKKILNELQGSTVGVHGYLTPYFHDIKREPFGFNEYNENGEYHQTQHTTLDSKGIIQVENNALRLQVKELNPAFYSGKTGPLTAHIHQITIDFNYTHYLYPTAMTDTKPETAATLSYNGLTASIPSDGVNKVAQLGILFCKPGAMGQASIAARGGNTFPTLTLTTAKALKNVVVKVHNGASNVNDQLQLNNITVTGYDINNNVVKTITLSNIAASAINENHKAFVSFYFHNDTAIKTITFTNMSSITMNGSYSTYFGRVTIQGDVKNPKWS